MSAVELDNAIRKWAASTACLTLAMILNEARLAFLLKCLWWHDKRHDGSYCKQTISEENLLSTFGHAAMMRHDGALPAHGVASSPIRFEMRSWLASLLRLQCLWWHDKRHDGSYCKQTISEENLLSTFGHAAMMRHDGALPAHGVASSPIRFEMRCKTRIPIWHLCMLTNQ
ncbi:uncharacterized protein TRIADDRAFT_62832 [Trichoplax adhaerens]|uniref:Uncharacterized protein n=1 Tax=Trichoplax adhaerens TaxID=10228 RepID=B3SF09_TRIAD|nr:predicted protein [Trichoplax adhaerens]EDV18686.1 predicted protein [Trichoplax adhaerens]|eukprot:XP_002118828.1 predicted protein [Trichoplax adhaerens]